METHNHGTHGHGTYDYSRAFAIGIALNITFVAAEAAFGVIAGSLALVADAGHNLSDVLSLGLAWGAAVLAARRSTDRRTYGFKRATIYSSLLSAILLLIALGGISWEAIRRLSNPRPVDGNIVVIVALIGVAINTATALLFARGRHDDLNIRGAFLHMAADAGISLGVVITGFAVTVTGWSWLDPLVSIGIVAVIAIATWGLLRESVNLSLDAVPKGINLREIESYLRNLDQVKDIHDLHVWALSTTETAMTVHVVTASEALDNGVVADIQTYLHEHHGIHHATIQLESADGSLKTLNCRECN
ncbi:MAG TPA: cation diffusion facilitator family transporter [Candidatus Latescibacteria bacterium]|nr:cation diffusion facilitator family transporter [Candidatus Latescibacterota bacterium]HOS63389.1 cation diffusion facilitator family transporter [Candidatus Latescibacterota bacterium]HPK75442.1 cation diffusion facilitator family transporter [Candidatus Latescibacterota bacterium]